MLPWVGTDVYFKSPHLQRPLISIVVFSRCRLRSTPDRTAMANALWIRASLKRRKQISASLKKRKTLNSELQKHSIPLSTHKPVNHRRTLLEKCLALITWWIWAYREETMSLITIQTPGMTHPRRTPSRILAWMADRKLEDVREKRKNLTKSFCPYTWLSKGKHYLSKPLKLNLTQWWSGIQFRPVWYEATGPRYGQNVRNRTIECKHPSCERWEQNSTC